MLNLLFIDKLSHEQDVQLLQMIPVKFEKSQKIKNFPFQNTTVRYQHNVYEAGRLCDLKITVYEINKEKGKQIMQELVKFWNFLHFHRFLLQSEKGLCFGYYFSSGDPFLTEKVAKMGEYPENVSDESMKAETEAIERKFKLDTPPPLPSAANSEVLEEKPLRMVAAGNNQQEGEY